MDVVFLAFEGVTLQDLVGAHEVLWRAPGVRATLCGVGSNRIVSEGGVALECDSTLGTSTRADMLVVPGGPGVNRLLADHAALERIADIGADARYITSVCTGSLVLAAAGLLEGYRATSHWRYRDLLALGGATPVDARVVRDRSRITGGGITAGIDFGLAIVDELWSRSIAQSIALMMEYDPQSPVGSGSPSAVNPEIVQRTILHTQKNYDERHMLLASRLDRIRTS
ncbi:MAG: DJ-1/PfpI family protein [Candidatus Eremiobacteraeota bacterium]|nr:DJ-1/PfpI family protein [Candidatus Eremiobacteraeota bacterium]